MLKPSIPLTRAKIAEIIQKFYSKTPEKVYGKSSEVVYLRLETFIQYIEIYNVEKYALLYCHLC